MNGRPKKSWRRKKSWVPEEWAEGREEEEGARTIDTGADRRQALRLAPVERDVDPLETWREEQRRAKEEAQRRAARSPWSNTGTRPLPSVVIDSGDEYSSDDFEGKSFQDTVTGTWSPGVTRRRRARRRPGSREYHKPWLAEGPQHEKTPLVLSHEKGKRTHALPRAESPSPGARETRWDRRTMLEHTKLWGGGGNWQKSVDDWEKKEEEKKAKAAAIASEAIHVSSPGSKRLGGAKSDNRDYQLLGAADADHLGRDGLNGGPSFISFFSSQSDNIHSEGDLALRHGSDMLSTQSSAAMAAGISWPSVERKKKWNIENWSDRLLGDGDMADGHGPSTRHGDGKYVVSIRRSRFPPQAVDSMEATLGLSESVSPSQQVDTTGSTSKMNTRLSPTVHRQGSSQSPLNKSAASRTGMEPFKLQYRPPAWELTASFNREFDDVSPPFVRFDGHKTSLQIFNEAKGMRASYGSEPSTNAVTVTVGGLGTDVAPVFPWIEQTMERGASDPWARDSYDDVGTTVVPVPAGSVPFSNPLPWRPNSPQRSTPNKLQDLPVHDSSKDLTLRTRTSLSLHALRLQLELEKDVTPAPSPIARSPSRLTASGSSSLLSLSRRSTRKVAPLESSLNSFVSSGGGLSR